MQDELRALWKEDVDPPNLDRYYQLPPLTDDDDERSLVLKHVAHRISSGENNSPILSNPDYTRKSSSSLRSSGPFLRKPLAREVLKDHGH